MSLQGVQRFRKGMDANGRLPGQAYCIRQERQAGDMVQMGMRQEHMIDPHKFCQRQVADTGPCINQDVVIDQH
jgi:hypothetical protein